MTTAYRMPSEKTSYTKLDSSLVNSLYTHIRQIMPPNTTKLFISNISPSNQKANRYYCVILSLDAITFASRLGTKKEVTTFHLKDHTLFHNNAPTDLSHLPELIRRVESALRDLDKKIAKMYH